MEARRAKRKQDWIRVFLQREGKLNVTMLVTELRWSKNILVFSFGGGG